MADELIKSSPNVAEMMADTLRFYADITTYDEEKGQWDAETPADMDGGERARSTLTAYESSKDNEDRAAPSPVGDDGLRTLDYKRDIMLLTAQFNDDEIACQRLDRLGKLIAALKGETE